MTKRVLSMLLVFAVLVSLLPVRTEATEPTVSQQDTQVGFEATNDFGGLLTNTLADSDQAQTASDVNRICDVQIEGDYAWVEFTTTERARLVVAIYTEDGTKMLGSGTQTVSPEETEVGIQIDIDNMPQYYSAGAYLLSAADNTPLSKEFRTQLYTKVVQDIKNSTVDDYDPERVLNLDDDRTTNFAVFGENTILLDSSVSITISGDTYTIENASDELNAMQPGDSFAQTQENGEVLIVKAAQVKVSGDTVTITDDPDADLSDVFEVVKIEGKSSPDNTVSDNSYLDPEWEVISDEEYWAEMGEETQGREMDVDESTSFKQKYKTGGDALSATLSADCTASVEAYLSLSYQYISWKFEAKITGKISLTAKFEKEIPIIKCDFYLAAGCYMTVSLNVVIKASASLSYSVSWKASIGRTYDSNYGEWEDTGSPPSTDSKTEFEGKLSFGGNIKIRIAFLSEKLTNITATAEIVREITGKQKVTELSSPSTSSIHDCTTCIEGKKEIVFTFSLVFELFGKEAASLPELSHSWKEGDFYYCNDEKEYGDGKCPHMLYKVTVVAKNTEDAPCRLAELSLYQNGEPVESVTLLDDKGQPYPTYLGLNSTDWDGISVFFVPNGIYRLEGQKGRVRVFKDITVHDKPKKCLLEFESTDEPNLLVSPSVISMILGQSKKLTANFGTEESNQSVTSACKWTTSDASILTVDNGVITPVSEGIAQAIAIYTKDGADYVAVCEVHVWERLFLHLSEEALTLCPGDPSTSVKAHWGYGIDTDKNVTDSCEWISSDPNIVTVDEGTITAIAPGTATITATYTTDKGVNTAQCKVTVETKPAIASGTCGSNLTWVLDDTGTLTIFGTGEMSDYRSSYDKTAQWHSYRNSITAVVIGKGVTSIGMNAFYDCSSLTSISIPETVTSIGKYAFDDCSILTNITVDAGNPAYHVDGNCLIETSSKTLVRGSSASVIPVDGSVTAIGDTAFSGSGLISITIPEGVTSIGDGAFMNCNRLTSINILEGVASIGHSAFNGCKNLTSIIIPEGVTSIGGLAFHSCTSLTSITIPEGVTSIKETTFYNCSSLASIILPQSVSSIGNSAFSGCSSLTSITIPEGVASIGNSAFSGCSNLTSITIPGDVASIRECTFYNCSSLTSITIPKSVTSIKHEAFSGCSSLTTITIPEGVVSIDHDAFFDCTSLVQIIIPNSVTTIGNSAFRNCSSLTSINLPDSVVSIKDRVFENCSSLASITIPAHTTRIGWSAFYNCSSLTNITIPECVTSIGDSAFYGCSSLTNIAIPNGITNIRFEMFYGCSSLTDITIPESVTSIGAWAFNGCSSLTDVSYSGTSEQWNSINISDTGNTFLTSATIHCSDGVILPTTAEDIAPASLVPEETEPTKVVTEPVAEGSEATIPEETQAVTEPVVVETQPEATEETTEPTEETTVATEETTAETSLVSHRSWRILPSGAEMRTGAVVKLAAFTGKETTQNGLRTVSFTGLEPGEEYVLIVSLVPGSVAPEDLMYIDQATANDSGALTLSYIPRQDVTAIIQLYGIPTDRGITLDREYVTMRADAASERLTATVTPAQWADTLVWESSDETVLQVGADGSLTPVAPGTAYAIATATHGKYTLSTRCRVDVTEEVPNVAVTAVALGTSKVTTQLYSRDYVNFDVLLLLEQNLPQIAAFSLEETPQDNGVAITGAKFADETVRSLFDLQVKDDRTLTLIPTQAAIAAGQTLKSSYSSPVIVSVNGVEFHTDSVLTISVRKSTPKLSAKALSFNSFYTSQTQAISITGGTPTAITGTTPDWLALEDGKLSLTGTETKASATVSLSVETEEWAIPATVKVKASVSYKAPSLKLSKTSLTFSNVHSKGIPLTLTGGKQTLAELGVRDLRADDGFAITDLNLEKGTFTLLPTGTVSPGKHTITVFFHGTESTLPLSVQVSTKAPTIRLSRSSVKLNARTGDSVTLKLTASPSDFDLTQVELSEATGTLTVTQVDEMGCFSLSTAPQSEASKSCSLTATAPGGNTARLTISMISAAPTMTAKASGKIDLSYPQTGLTITPVLKNYSGALTSPVYSLSVKSGKGWEDMDIATQFTLSSNGKLYQAPTFSLPSGTLCRITLQGQLPDGTPMLASVLVKVTQTPIPLKLSKSSLTLNKALGEWASITVSTSVRGYPLGTPEIRLTDSKGFPSQALDFHYQDGQLKVAVNDATAYGQTYQLRLWVTPTKVAILRVKILSEKQSSVVLSAKAKGSIDVIRDDSEIVITPSYRNYAGQMPLTRQVRITMAQSKEKEAQDVSHQFLWAWSSDGKLHLQKAPGALLDLTARYRLELSVEGGAKAAVVNLNLRSGSAKVRLTQPAVLYAKDVNSQSLLTFQISDKSLNALEHVQIRGAKQNERFAIVPWAGSQFSIIQVPGSTPKSSRITLELFFEGNTTQKPNAIVTASVTIR